MSAFPSGYGYWDFAKTVRTERRWILDGKAAKFLAAVRAAGKSRTHLVKSGTRFYRAQAGSIFVDDDQGVEWEHPLPETRMVPDPKFMNAGGRANPQGFAYLYLATTPETALAEMRPWLNESLTLALFEAHRDLKLVVCRAGGADLPEWLLERKLSVEERSKRVWNDISKAFARPVSRTGQEGAYLPTQILAEAFKAEGFDGLAYSSGLERGTNIVVFDVGLAKPTRIRFVYSLKKVRYDFEAAPNYGIYRVKSDGNVYLDELHTETPER